VSQTCNKAGTAGGYCLFA